MKNPSFSRSAALVLASGTILAVFAGTALATDRAKTDKGANFEAAHARAEGTGVTIGIIDLEGYRSSEEFGAFTRGIIDQEIQNPNAGIPGEDPTVPGHTLGARFMGNFSYSNIAPRKTPTAYAVGTGTDRHPTLAANIAAGDMFRIKMDPPAVPADRDFIGVAKSSNVYFAGIGGDSLLTDLQSATDDLARNTNKPMDKRVRVMNLSVGMGASESGDAQAGGAGGADSVALYLDWFINKRDITFIKSAGNRGGQDGFRDDETRPRPGDPELPPAADKKISRPGDFYNGITVGSTDESFRARALFSSYQLGGPDSEIRGKPDILAPGDRVWDGKSYRVTSGASGTSFAAPHVTGAAAMLEERIATGRKHEAIKAIILNSARKNKVEGANNGANAVSKDHATTSGEASDKNYLNAGANGFGDPAAPVNTADWTPSKWTVAGGVFKTERPLDDEQGTGVLDVNRAIDQFYGLEHAPGTVTPIGWSRNKFVRSSDASGQPDVTKFDYKLDMPITPGTFLTTTLAWDRIVSETDAGHTNDPADPNSPPDSALNLVDRGDTYSFNNLTDLNLQILKKNTTTGNLDLIAESISTTDNVEHLHIPIVAGGEYTIRVLWAGEANDGNSLLTQTPYALAWFAVPTPGTITLSGLASLLLLRRRRAS